MLTKNGMLTKMSLNIVLFSGLKNLRHEIGYMISCLVKALIIANAYIGEIDLW